MIDLGLWAGGKYRVPSTEALPSEIREKNDDSEDAD